MIDPQREIYEFEGFTLDVVERRLLKNGDESNITPKAFDLLALLVRESGHLLTKDRIIEELWSGSFVEEANLNVNISALRRVLGDSAAEQRFIETVPRQGYRFVAEVRRRIGSAEDVEVEPEEEVQGTAVASPQMPADVRVTKRVRVAPVIAVSVVLLALAGGAWYGYRSLATASGKPRSIAVLPFRPLARTSSDGSLEMGMTDALITKLGKVKQLTVRPTSAVRKFAEEDTDAVEAGRELRVDAVLDGKVQRDGNKVRVSVQLLRVADGETLWSEVFDDFFTNIFAVQDSISEKMIRSLSVRLSPVEQDSIEKRHTESAEAYELYLQAQNHHLQITADGSRNAIEYYEQAVKLDPKYAMAWANSVGAYAHIAGLNENREENLQKARIAAYIALSLDPELPEAHEAVATILDFFDWNWEEAEREYKKAIELGPNRDGPHYAYSIFLSRFKRHDEAVREIRIAQQILPDAVFVQNQLVQTLYRARRYDECLQEAERSLTMKPDGVGSLGFMFRAYLQLSKYAEAEGTMNRLIALDPSIKDPLRARLYLQSGRAEEGKALIRQTLVDYSSGDNAWPLAQSYMRLGDFDKAFEMLEHSYRRREANVTMINVEPEWDSIRGDPRYTDLMRRIGIPP